MPNRAQCDLKITGELFLANLRTAVGRVLRQKNLVKNRIVLLCMGSSGMLCALTSYAAKEVLLGALPALWGCLVLFLKLHGCTTPAKWLGGNAQEKIPDILLTVSITAVASATGNKSHQIAQESTGMTAKVSLVLHSHSLCLMQWRGHVAQSAAESHGQRALPCGSAHDGVDATAGRDRAAPGQDL